MQPLVLTNSNSLPKNHPSMMAGKQNADCSDFVPQATWVNQLEDIWVVTARQHLVTWFSNVFKDLKCSGIYVSTNKREDSFRDV